MKKNRIKVMLLALGVMLSAFFSPIAAQASDGNGSVNVDLPSGWQTKEYVGQVKPYEFTKGNTKILAKSVSVSFDDGVYTDITDCMQVTIRENGVLSIKVLYTDDSETVGTFYIENFDLEQPTVNARLEGEILYLSAKDEISGVKELIVNGSSYSELTDGQMCIDVKALENTNEYFTVYAKDVAGNESKKFIVKNPYYVGETESGSSDKSLNNPDSIEATDPTNARGTVTEQTENKQFYTIMADEKTFYLVIDNTMSKENVYLLTEAGANDLLNFVDYNGVDVENGDIPLYEIKENEAVETEVSTTKEEAKVKESKNSGGTLLIILLAGGVGAAYYFYKSKKNDADLADAEEMDVFEVPEEEEDNYLDEEDDEFTSMTERDLTLGVDVEYLDEDEE